MGAIVGSSLVLAQNPPGLHPRSTPADYAVSQQLKTGTYAASLVPADQVKHIFAVDISKTYVVFEVACYPSQMGIANLDPDDFLIKVGATGEFVHPADSITVASVIQEKNTPKPPSRSDTNVYSQVGVGYESTTDPYTGRRIHGTYTEAGVGVAKGGPPPPYDPAPGSLPQDRALLEQQLAQKALPPGNFTTPVAGFLYFPADSLKKKSNGSYELEYLSDASGKVHLVVPSKTH